MTAPAQHRVPLVAALFAALLTFIGASAGAMQGSAVGGPHAMTAEFAPGAAFAPMGMGVQDVADSVVNYTAADYARGAAIGFAVGAIAEPALGAAGAGFGRIASRRGPSHPVRLFGLLDGVEIRIDADDMPGYGSFGGEVGGGGGAAVEGQLPKYLYHYTSTETAALIESSALGQAGRTLYLTPSAGLSPLQAGIELALPQANTASALFRVPTSALEAGQILRVGPVTGNVLGRGGGGIEILYNGEISLNFVARVR